MRTLPINKFQFKQGEVYTMHSGTNPKNNRFAKVYADVLNVFAPTPADYPEPYKRMYAELMKIADTHHLFLTNCDVFEKTFFYLFNIDHRKIGHGFEFGCVPNAYYKYAYITFEANNNNLAAITKKLQTVRKKNASIIYDVHTQIEQSPTTANYSDNQGNPIYFGGLGMSCFTSITLVLDAIQVSKLILPKMQSYLQSHSDFTREMYCQSSNLYKMTSLKTIFYKKGLIILDQYSATAKSLEEAICRAAKEKPSEAKVQKDVILRYSTLTYDDVFIIQEYLNPLAHVDTTKMVLEPKDITAIHPDAEDPTLSVMSLEIPTSQGNRILSYFSLFADNAAQESKSYDDVVRIKVKNEVLNHPDFLMDMRNMLNTYSQEKLEEYQVKSESIKYTTNECLSMLKQTFFKPSASQNKAKMQANLSNSIAELVNHLETEASGLRIKLTHHLIENIRQQLNEIAGVMKKSSSSLISQLFSDSDKEERKEFHVYTATINDILNNLWEINDKAYRHKRNLPLHGPSLT